MDEVVPHGLQARRRWDELGNSMPDRLDQARCFGRDRDDGRVRHLEVRIDEFDRTMAVAEICEDFTTGLSDALPIGFLVEPVLHIGERVKGLVKGLGWSRMERVRPERGERLLHLSKRLL